MRVWDRKAPFYRRWRSLPLARKILRQETEAARRLLGKDFGDPAAGGPAVVLDVGTGCGVGLPMFPDHVKVIGMDRSLAMLRNIPAGVSMLRVAGDALRLPFGRGRFSIVTAVGISEYLRDQGQFLSELGRVCASGGRCLVTLAPITLPNVLRFFLGHRLHLQNPERWMRKARGRGFSVLETAGAGFQFLVLLGKPSSF
jgi:ubiquinone/menaquinone biosynthesis C-methylase UbiE